MPDQRLQRAFDAARQDLLLVNSDDPGPASVAAPVVAALARTGRHSEADGLARTLWTRQRTDGSFDEPSGRGAPGGPHLWALGEHLRLRPDLGLARVLDRSLVAAEGWLRELEGRGALAADAQRWAAAGRRVAGHAAGEAGLAGAAAALFAGLGAGGPETGEPVPASSAAGVLALGQPHHPVSVDGHHAVPGPAGYDVVGTVAVAAAEVLAGDPRALVRLSWLLEAGEPTWSWPDHVFPRTGAGSEGSGHSVAATAAFVLLVRDLLLIEPAPGHAVILPLLAEAWRGQALEVDGAVLSGGTSLSFAVRWHGPRPALLWEASSPLRLTAPGLDPSFSATGRQGEALLAAPDSTAAPDGGTVEIL